MYRPTISTLAALTAVSCAGGAFAQDPASAASNVEVKTLEKTGTALVGSAAVAASGPLASFGDIGVGCGINWTESAAFGGKGFFFFFFFFFLYSIPSPLGRPKEK